MSKNKPFYPDYIRFALYESPRYVKNPSRTVDIVRFSDRLIIEAKKQNDYYIGGTSGINAYKRRRLATTQIVAGIASKDGLVTIWSNWAQVSDLSIYACLRIATRSSIAGSIAYRELSYPESYPEAVKARQWFIDEFNRTWPPLLQLSRV